MALNIVKLIDLIKKHNDPNDATRIISIQGTSVANFFPERMKKDDVINIESGDIVWKEYGDHKEQDPVIYRTGLNNIDQIKFIPAPGEDIILDNGKVDTGNGKDIVEDDDGNKYKLIPGPQGDKGETGARGEKGEKGDMSIITLNKENGHWMIDGVDTEVSAIGPKGDKVSVTIDPSTKHWVIDGEDTNVVAEGKDGKTPEIKIDPVTKRWIIDGIDTNIVSEGVKGEKGEKTLVTIDPATKHWMIDGVDTNVLAEGVKGDTGAEARLSIDPETKHFIINGVDSGVRAEGVKGIDGVTPEISINEVSKNWIINGHDTEIKAEGTKGEKGEKTLVTIDPNTKHWLIDGVDTNVLAEGTKGADGVDGKSAFDIATEKGFTGSKDEWLESLKGAKGVDGHDGRSANNLEVDPILLGNFRNNDASGIEVLMIGPRFNDEELSESEITENLQVTALFRGFNLRNSNENDDWKDINNLTIEQEDGNYVVKGLPFTDGVRKGDSLELILNFEYKGVDRHYYRRLDNINDGVGSVNLDKYIRREDLPATLDTSHLIARKEVEETYAKKSELPVVPSLDPYATKEEADGKYATKESLSSVSEEVNTEKGKLSSLTDRVTAIEESKSTLATKEEVDTTYAKKSELPVVPSLEPYATKADSDEKYVSKEELVTLGNLNDKATKADLKNYYTKEETVNKETHDALNNKVESNISEISTVKEKVTGLESSNTTVKEKIESLASDVNLLKAKEDSDKQTLSLEGNKLTISSGNEVDLSALKTDNSAIERSVSTLNETVTGLKNRLPESIQEDDKLSTSREVTEKVNSLKTEVETTYAKKSELPNVEGLITETRADEKYSGKSLETTVSSLDEKVRNLEAKEDNDRQTLSITDRTITISGSNSSVTVPEQDLSSLATKADVERDYAKKSELPSVNGLISETTADERYLPKTKEETLATKEELDVVKGKVTALESKEDSDKQTLSIDGRTISISGSDSSVTVPEQDLSGLATKADVELTYAKKEQVEKLASKSEIEGLRKLVTGSKVDTSGFITSDDADSKYARKDVMETTYAKKSELPSVEGLITEIKADGKYLEKSKEETLATKEEVKAIKDRLPELTDGEKLAKASDIPSLVNYATKEELPSTVGLISENKADEKYIAKSTESSLATKNELEEVKGKVNALETKEDSDKQTLSITGRTITISGSNSSVEVPEQDLSGLATKADVDTTYAKKSELPSVNGLITETAADEKYLPKSKEGSLATKEELTQKISEATNGVESKLSNLLPKSEADKNYLHKDIESNLATKNDIGEVSARISTLENKPDNDKQLLSIVGRTITISGSDSSVTVPEQDLSGLAKKSELPSVEGLISETKADEKYVSKSEKESLATKEEVKAIRDHLPVLTGEEKLAKTSDIPSVSGLISEATADTKYLEKSKEATLATKAEVKDIADKLPELAKKSELPSVEGLITEVKADGKYAPKTDLETAKERISVLESKEDADKQTLSITGRTITISGSNSSVEVPEQDLSSLVTKDDAELKYAKKEQVEQLASKSEIEGLRQLVTGSKVDTSGLLSKEDAGNTYLRKDVAETSYAKKSEIPNVEEFITESKVAETYATRFDLEGANIKINSLEYQVNREKPTLSIEGNTITISGSNSSVTVPEQDLSGLATKSDVERDYAKKSELPTIDGLISEATADTKYLPKSKEDTLATKIELTQKIGEATSSVEGKLSLLAAKSEVDKTYAKKSELPSVAGLITEVRADDKYLAKSKESTLATKAELNTISGRTTAIENKLPSLTQDISISGNELSISGGSTVHIPTPDLSGYVLKSSLDTAEVNKVVAKNTNGKQIATTDDVNNAVRGKTTISEVQGLGYITTSTADGKYLPKTLESQINADHGKVTNIEGRLSTLESRPDNDRQTLSINNRTITISGSNSSVTVPEQDLSGLATKSDVDTTYAKKSELPNIEGINDKITELENKRIPNEYYFRNLNEISNTGAIRTLKYHDIIMVGMNKYMVIDEENKDKFKTEPIPNSNLFVAKYFENSDRNKWINEAVRKGKFTIAYGGLSGDMYDGNIASISEPPASTKALIKAFKLGFDAVYVDLIRHVSSKGETSYYVTLNSENIEREYKFTRGSLIVVQDTFNYDNKVSTLRYETEERNYDNELPVLDVILDLANRMDKIIIIGEVYDTDGHSVVTNKEQLSLIPSTINDLSGKTDKIGIVSRNLIESFEEWNYDPIHVLHLKYAEGVSVELSKELMRISMKRNSLVILTNSPTYTGGNTLTKQILLKGIPIVFNTNKKIERYLFNAKVVDTDWSSGYMSSSVIPDTNYVYNSYEIVERITLKEILKTNPEISATDYSYDKSNNKISYKKAIDFKILDPSKISEGMIIKANLYNIGDSSLNKLYLKNNSGVKIVEDVSRSLSEIAFSELVMLLEIPKKAKEISTQYLMLGLTPGDNTQFPTELKDIYIELLVPKHEKVENTELETVKRRISTLESNSSRSNNTNNGTKYYVRTIEELKALDVQVDDVVRFKDKVYKIVKDVTPFSLKYFGGIILDKTVDGMNLVATEYIDSYIRSSWIKNRPSGNFNIAYCGYTGLPYKSNANLNSVPCTLKAISDAYKVGYDGIYVPTLKYFNNKWYISTTDEVGPILSNSQGVELLSYSHTHTRINSEIAETKTFNSNNYVDRNLLTVEEFLNVCKKYNMYAFMSIQTINKNTFDNSSQEAYAELARIINDSGHSSMIGLSGDNIQIEILDFVIRVRDKILSENLINVIFIDASTENYTLERELLILQKYKNNLVIIGDRDDHDGNEILSAYGPSHQLYNFLKEVKKMGIPIVYQTDRREQRELFDKVIEKTGCIGLLSSAIAPYGKNLSDNYAVQSRNNMSSIINLAVNKDNMSSRFTMNSDNTIMTATASNITQNNEFELLNVSDITDGMLIRVRLQGKTSGSQTASCKIYVKDIPDNENVSNMISFNSSSYIEREMILPLSKNTFNSRYNDKKVVINLTADSGDSIISFKDLVVEVLIPKDKNNTTAKLISSVNYESYNNKDIYVDSEIQKAKLGDMIHYNNEDYVVVSKDDELISGLVTESTNGIIKIGENYALRIHNQEDINQWLNSMKNTDNIKIADGGFTGKSNVDNEFVPVYPKNTTLSVEKAGELGFDAVKVNITPTKDNVWVCSDETTLVNVKDNSFKNRNIADLNYDNIKGLELEGENVVRFNKDTETYRWTYRDGQCKGQTIPSLEQIVKICSKYGMMIFITSANLTANFDYVTKVLKKYGYTSRTALVGDRFIMKYSNKLPDAVSIFDGSMKNVKIYNEKFLRTFKNFGFISTPGGVSDIFRQTSNFKIDTPFFLNANYQYNLGNYQSLSNFRINGFITGAVPSDLNIREGYSILRTYTSKEINEWTDRKNNNSASASVVKQSNGNIIIQSSGGSAGKYISFERNLENYPVGTIINISAMCRKIEKNVDGGTISFWSDTTTPRRINTFTTYFNEEFFEKKDVSFIVNEETGGSFQIFIGNFNGVGNNQPFKAEFKDIVVRIYVPNAVYRDIDKESIERKIADISSKMEIRGEGYPRNKRELNNVPNGTIYTDTLATKGAVKWIRLNGKWKVTVGDTGWKKLNAVSVLGNAFIKVRRVNDIVTYDFGGLQWGWFGIIRRGGAGHVKHGSSRERGAKVLNPGGIPDGFRSNASLMGPIFNDLGNPYGVWYMGGKSDSNYIQFTFNDPIPTDRDIGDIRVSSVSYITDDDWENITIE